MLPPHVAARDPSTSELDLQANAEMMRWPVARQKAALTLLRFSHVATTVNLRSLQLTDDVAPTLAAVLAAGSDAGGAEGARLSSVEVLNLDSNDLREGGLLELVEALRNNTTLRELRYVAHRPPDATRRMP